MPLIPHKLLQQLRQIAQILPQERIANSNINGHVQHQGDGYADGDRAVQGHDDAGLYGQVDGDFQVNGDDAVKIHQQRL